MSSELLTAQEKAAQRAKISVRFPNKGCLGRKGARFARFVACSAIASVLACAGSTAAQTYDTFDTDPIVNPNITFSNGNLTAATSGASNTLSVWAQTVEGKKSGKWYIECTVNAVSGNGPGFGVVPAWGGGDASSNGFIGGVTTSSPGNDQGWAYYAGDFVLFDGTRQTAVNNSGFGVSSVVGEAIDLTNGKIWWTTNGTAWVGTSGTPNPATNSGGFDISHMLTGNSRVYVGVNLNLNTQSATCNLGASPFHFSPPAGFTAGWTNTTSGTYFGTFASNPASPNNQAFPGANTAYISAYTATVTGAVSTVVMPFAGTTTTDLKGLIYANNSGHPGALLGISTNIITSGTYGENVFTFSGVNVTAGATYWVGAISDSASSNTNNVMLGVPGGVAAVATDSYASPSPTFPAAGPAESRIMTIVNIAPSVSASRHRLIESALSPPAQSGF